MHLTDNLINNYKVFDNFGRYPEITHFNWQRNPLHTSDTANEVLWNVVSRIPKIMFINKSELFHEEKNNCYV
jgi:hypothetical protein